MDFDNTIVCYDEMFHRAASELSLIPAAVHSSKEKVRDYLRAAGREDAWTELQGYVYGVLVPEAPLYPGVVDFFRACRARQIPVAIVSHKTRHPFIGPPYDLPEAAHACLHRNGFFEGDIGLTAEDVFFEPTKAGKIARITALGCTHFIDDLPEFLTEDGFPAGADRILFDPNGHHTTTAEYRRTGSWLEIRRWLVGA